MRDIGIYLSKLIIRKIKAGLLDFPLYLVPYSRIAGRRFGEAVYEITKIERRSAGNNGNFASGKYIRYFFISLFAAGEWNASSNILDASLPAPRCRQPAAHYVLPKCARAIDLRTINSPPPGCSSTNPVTSYTCTHAIARSSHETLEHQHHPQVAAVCAPVHQRQSINL